MKPQQLLNEASAPGRASQAHSKCARIRLPTLTAIAVAIASSVALTLSGCANGAGTAPVSQPVAPTSAGLDSNAVAPIVVAD